MEFPIKRLSEYSYNTSDSIDICLQACFSESSSCVEPCFSVCKLRCPSKIPSQHHKNTNNFLILGAVLSSIFFVFFCVSIYYKFFCSQSSRIRRSSQLQDQRNENQDFLDEDHTVVLDHPVWYINTIGLQPSVINSISVFQYKRCDGLVDGTECSVCLNEFQENEALRLLPKCSHAFHVPCIDTWLRSHTNCPVCRAPIVANSAQAGSTDSDNESSRVGIEEENEISNRDEEEEEIEPIRRSVSLESSPGLRSSEHVSCNSSMNSYTPSRAESESDVGIVQKRVESNQNLFNLMSSSSLERSLQICPSSLMKRSFSCSGKLFLSRYTRKNKSILPL